MKASVEVAGRGLFSGQNAAVRLLRASGPLRIRVGGRERALGRLEARARGRTSALFDGESVFLSCVEHLFAAVGALGVSSDLVVESSADELPLLDGGAARWAESLTALFPNSSLNPASLRVAREGVVCVGPSEYSLRPGAARRVAVSFETTHPEVAREAAWDGDADDFVRRIAPARTFVEERELALMLASGQSATADPESVVVLGAETVHAAGRPFSADEPARHKLLDLIGDLALHGGPPRGEIVARRPGHAATHVAVARALADGILARDA